MSRLGKSIKTDWDLLGAERVGDGIIINGHDAFV